MGVPAALAAATAGFALAHAPGRPGAVPLHLVTGASFAAAFAVTGSLAAAVGAHATYNVLLASSAPPRAGP